MDVEAGHRIVEAKLERIAEQIAGQKHERGGVRPQDRRVGQHKEPRDEESVVGAKRLDRKCEGAAWTRRTGVKRHVRHCPFVAYPQKSCVMLVNIHICSSFHSDELYIITRPQ